MPLRVLLLLPDGEQPTIAAPPKSPSNSSFKTILNGAGGGPSRSQSPRLSSHNGDYSSKPLPSPPPRMDSVNRSSSQTHLTLPSTSGSSAGSSTREYAPSPPLSPSPTTSSTPGSPFRAPSPSSYDDQADMTITPVRGLKLFKKKGKPRLTINTKLPKTGRGVRYISSSSASRASGEDWRGQNEGSTSNDHGEATARKAVDARLNHLLKTTGLSPVPEDVDTSEAKTFSTPQMEGIPSPRLVLPKQNRLSHGRHGKRESGGRGRQLTSHQNDPPPPPMSGLAPYRIFGAGEEAPIDLLADPGRAKRVPVRVGWSRTGIRVRASRARRTRGRYIRLITAPPLPPKKEEELDYEEEVASIRLKGRMPTVLMEDNALEKDDGDEEESEKPAPVRREVPTVYMTELVASQCDRPIPCMMIPVPVQPGHAPGSTHRNSILSQRLSTISSFHPQQILTPQSKAYQLPLPFLSTVQKAALVEARLLVYAVPPGYTGPIPPPECAMVGEEIVPPWVTATSQLPVLSPGSPSSPRGSALGLSLRGFPSPRNSVLSQSGLGPGPGPSGSLSPRWPVEGLWSRARGAGNSPRNSTMSVLSAEGSAASRPTSLLPQEKTDGEETGATVSTWTTSFSSIRSKAQELYTRDKDQQQAPARTSSSDDGRLPTSKSDVRPTGTASDESAPIPTSLSTSASRAFGSLFLRTPGANTSSTAGPGGALSPSGVATPSTAGLQTPGLGPGPGMGEVLFEFTEPPKDGEIVKVEIIEAPPAPAASRWRGWGARWGS